MMWSTKSALLSIALTLAASSTVAGEGCIGDCVAVFGKCAGNGIDGSLPCCDDDGVRCVKKNEFYSQCRPDSKPIPSDWDGDILTCGDDGPPPALTACVGDCVGTYERCAGKGIDGLKACCEEDDQCVMKNIFYSQCRPVSKPVPDDWAGVVVDCTTCGPESAEIGEFIDEDCNVNFLDGGLTIAECDNVCASNGYVACDRPVNAAPNEGASCYGYVEAAPGACSMRSVDDTFWLSWLTCRVDGVPIPAGGMYGDIEEGPTQPTLPTPTPPVAAFAATAADESAPLPPSSISEDESPPSTPLTASTASGRLLKTVT